MVNGSGNHDAAADDQHASYNLIRIFYMVYSMAIGCVIPFLSIYYKSLGHGGKVIGLIESISPFTTFLVGPIWGIISDKVRSPFLILYITSAMSMLGQLLVFLVHETRSIMILVYITALFSAPVKPLIDSLVMARLGKDRAQFGRLRLFSILGSGTASSIAGRFLKMEDETQDYIPPSDTANVWLWNFWQSMTGFKLLVFAYVVLHIPTFICIRLFQKENEAQKKISENDEKKPTDLTASMKGVIGITVRDKTILLFFALVYLMGISAGTGDSFVYIRFQEAGGNPSNMGTSRLLSSLGGAAMFWHSGRISAWLGMEKVLVFSLFVVAIRFTLLYYMTNIYFGYLAELLRGMTFGCFWSSATVYASQLAPAELQTTMIQVLSGIYNGIGRSSGALIGGNLQAAVGTANTFKYGAMANAAAFSVLLLQGTAKKESNDAVKKDK
ncbi:unnamed protein product [Cylindrotheca closterium]|uniref:Major facilitator superfamily (MFS) profile domain-containing protein n=1 Tax=Cylindrotheca closterium TaxID=2856 RepID=A0AAD2G0D3_9STRA|nr:unnamed protein product [Cylindrotheca closterium]